MAKKKEKNPNSGLMVLMVCGIIAVLLIVGCVFFPDEIFGLFLK